MAKIKVEQDSGEVTVTRAGETSKTYRVSGGTITVRKDEVRSVLAALPGSSLVDGTASDDDSDSTEYVDSPPELPQPGE